MKVSYNKEYTFFTGTSPYVRINTGKYANTSFSYGEVQLIEEQDALKLAFQLQILDGDITLEANQDFINYVGNILETLMRENF